MLRRILCRLFRAGCMPAGLRAMMRREGIVVADEGMTGWLITKDVHGPGVRYRHRREGFCGWLALSRERVLCYTFRRRQISIAVDDPRMGALHVDAPDANTLSISFDPGVFREGWRGAMELRFRTERANRFARALTGAGARAGRL